MSEKVAAIAIVYEKQKISSYKMIESFRNHNPDSTILVMPDGQVDGIEDICNKYGCEFIDTNETIGYPASTDINVPISFLHRFFKLSLRLKEKYFINLEPDCLVTGNITIPYENYDCIVNQDPTLCWIFYFRGDKQIQSLIIREVFSFYENEGVYKEPIHDKIMGGGGDIYNMNFVRTIYNEWDKFVERSHILKDIYKKHTENFVWYQDYLLSLQLPFYGQSKYGGSRNYINNLNDLDLKSKILHPYKQYYV